MTLSSLTLISVKRYLPIARLKMSASGLLNLYDLQIRTISYAKRTPSIQFLQVVTKSKLFVRKIAYRTYIVVL